VRKAHVYDDRLAGPREIAEAILGSPLSPRVQTTTRAEALRFYRDQMFLPDGTPNAAGREELLAKVGVEGFEKIAVALAKGG